MALFLQWWRVLLSAFLLFDLSMRGYARSAAPDAISYNVAHGYAWPAVAATVALVTRESLPTLSACVGVVACAWAFHVGVDRALGYSLKLPDVFNHTHLGRIGEDRTPN